MKPTREFLLALLFLYWLLVAWLKQIFPRINSRDFPPDFT
jgi:hypothetical protein